MTSVKRKDVGDPIRECLEEKSLYDKLIFESKAVDEVRKLGFIKHHQVGSHVQLKHPDGRRTTIPYHPSRELPRGTLRGILNDIDLTVDEFIMALKR